MENVERRVYAFDKLCNTKTKRGVHSGRRDRNEKVKDAVSWF